MADLSRDNIISWNYSYSGFSGICTHDRFWLYFLGALIYLLQMTFRIFERTRWRLTPKRVVSTKWEMYVAIDTKYLRRKNINFDFWLLGALSSGIYYMHSSWKEKVHQNLNWCSHEEEMEQQVQWLLASTGREWRVRWGR